jgi:spermidine/putrescine transport system permease protein
MRDRGLLARGVLAIVLVLLYAPLVFLVVASINRNPLSTSWQGFTLDWYRAAWNDPALRDAVRVSVTLAGSASGLAVVIGTAGAVAARRTRWLVRIASGAAVSRIATPEIVIATGIAAFLPAVDVSFGRRSMLIAHVAYLSAYVMLIVGARAAGGSVTAEEAAMDLGASRIGVVRDIVLPDLVPAIVSAGLLTLAFSLDDVALSLALRGPEDTTVPVYILSAVQRRVTPSIHAIGAVTIAAGVTVVVLAMLVNRAVVGVRRPR